MAAIRHILKRHPNAINQYNVGTYPLHVFSGGGYFYDEVLKYRVWVRGSEGMPLMYAFPSFKSAFKYSESHEQAEQPLVLVLQEHYIDEPSEDKYVLVDESRMTEWQTDWLQDAKASDEEIQSFLARNA